MDKEIVEKGLKDIVDEFNKKMKDWAWSTGYGANFGFRYGDYGAKYLMIMDVAPIPALPEDKKVLSAESILRESLAAIAEPAKY
jgi:hypothetical protein